MSRRRLRNKQPEARLSCEGCGEALDRDAPHLALHDGSVLCVRIQPKSGGTWLPSSCAIGEWRQDSSLCVVSSPSRAHSPLDTRVINPVKFSAGLWCCRLHRDYKNELRTMLELKRSEDVCAAGDNKLSTPSLPLLPDLRLLFGGKPIKSNEQFFEFCMELLKVHQARRDGLPAPWSRCCIFVYAHLENPHDQLDATSQLVEQGLDSLWAKLRALPQDPTTLFGALVLACFGATRLGGRDFVRRFFKRLCDNPGCLFCNGTDDFSKSTSICKIN
jgi:hypothetical protein